MRIHLIGLPYGGKTTIGQKLARRLNISFFDTDLLLQEKDPRKRSARDIYLEEGENQFRQKEKELLKSFIFDKSYILATGGGILTYPETAEILLERGSLVYLKVSPLDLFQRIKQNPPSYLEHPVTLKQWLCFAERRMALYQKYATVTFKVEQESEEKLLNELEVYGRGK